MTTKIVREVAPVARQSQSAGLFAFLIESARLGAALAAAAGMTVLCEGLSSPARAGDFGLIGQNDWIVWVGVGVWIGIAALILAFMGGSRDD